MRILVLSDLHDDFWAVEDRNPFEGIEQSISELDHLVLAGDISNKPKIRWKFAFERLSRLLPLDRVSLFPGNHDFYDFRFDGEARLQKIAASFGINYVQKQQLDLGTARLLCATLWTDLELGYGFASNSAHIPTHLNDYKRIRVAARGFAKLRPADVVVRHREHRAWLAAKLEQRFDGKTFVATHHAPHPDVLQMYSEGLEAAYASDLGDMIEAFQPDAWFFGHSHDARDMRVGDTILKNVSLGYPDEVADPSQRIESLIFEI